MHFLNWDELTLDEKKQATETYLCIREEEEERQRVEVNEEYTKPIDADGVLSCRFEREQQGKYTYINVII